MRNFSPIITPSVTPYTTVTGAESRYESMDVNNNQWFKGTYKGTS